MLHVDSSKNVSSRRHYWKPLTAAWTFSEVVEPELSLDSDGLDRQ